MKSDGRTTVKGTPVARSALVFANAPSIDGTPIGASGCHDVVL